MRSNCVIFAVLLYLRRRKQGVKCYVAWRRSYWGPFPHFLYAEPKTRKVRFISYIPTNPRHKKCPPPLFTGRVKWGDD